MSNLSSPKYSPHNKNTATLLAFWGGFLGLHFLYLRKPIWQIVLQILLLIIAIPSIIYLVKHDWQFGLAWLGLTCGLINILISYICAICYGLWGAKRWHAYLNDNDAYILTQDFKDLSTTGVFTAIMALLFGCGFLMTYIALLSQRYYEFYSGMLN